MKIKHCKVILGPVILLVVILFTGCVNTAVEKTKPVTEIKSEKTESNPPEIEKSKLEDVEKTGDNKFLCSYDNVRHDFITDFPEDTKGAPLVIMLHGYSNTAESFRNMVHFEKDALPKGYGVVYVTGAADLQDQTSGIGWNSGLGDGANKDTDFLKALVSYLKEEYSFDEKRIYAAGFSNGAFMTHRLAVEASDTFAAVVSVAGFMTETIWNERGEENDIGIFQITGEKDDVVPKNSDGSAKYNKAPAIEEVMDYWVSSNGLKLYESGTAGKGSKLEKYGSEDGKKVQVWNLFVSDGRHSWPDEKVTGIETNSLIIEFLEKNVKY